MLRPVFLIILMSACLSSAQPDFDQYFINKTLRVDYFHTGTFQNEYFSLDEMFMAGEWPGSRVNLIDTLNYGKYLFKVYDLATNQLIYSYGYSTIFGEYQTTLDAKNGIHATMHESVRCPFPKKPVQITISVRNSRNIFEEKFSTTIDPNSRFVNREKKQFPYKINKFINNGPSANKVDIVILGDGYTHDEIYKFHQDVERYTKDLFTTKPFDSRRKDFNIWTIDVESRDSGIDEPRKDIWRNTVLNTHFNSLDSPRYVLTTDNKTLRDIAGMVPYDQIYILVNSNRYGGGGIYNWMSTSFTGQQPDKVEWWSDYVFVHEFGHAFGGLADEYYTSNTSYDEFYPPGVDPWEPNITCLLDPEHPKWESMLTPGIQIPTPWEKSTYDSLGTILRSYVRDTPEYIATEVKMRQVMDESKWKNKIGCFEGAGYSSTGIYRPTTDCRMFSKRVIDFCPVCQQSIDKVIDFIIE